MPSEDKLEATLVRLCKEKPWAEEPKGSVGHVRRRLARSALRFVEARVHGNGHRITGAVIGAGSIVTPDVDRYAVVVGNPARKHKDRFEPELVAAIEESR